MVLENFQFAIEPYGLLQVHEWVHQTLRTITSPVFNELVIWFLHMTHSWNLLNMMSVDGWKAVDASLNTLAGRNPDFRVVFRGDFEGDYGVIHQSIESNYLPLASLKGFVKFEQVLNVEDRLFNSITL